MAILLKDLKPSVRKLPPKILVYGPEGIGKTTFASQFPKPLFIKAEEGQGSLHFASYPFADGGIARSYQEILDAIADILSQERVYETLIVDTITSVEPLIHAKLCAEYGEPNIVGNVKGSPFSYEAGIKLAAAELRYLLTGLDKICEDKKMIVIVNAHQGITKVKSPDTEDYDKWDIEVERKYFASVLRKWPDAIFHLNFQKPTLVQEDQGFNKKKSKAKVDEEPARYVYTQPRHAHTAKNRYQLPYEILFEEQGTADLILERIRAVLETEE